MDHATTILAVADAGKIERLEAVVCAIARGDVIKVEKWGDRIELKKLAPVGELSTGYWVGVVEGSGITYKRTGYYLGNNRVAIT